MFTSARENKGTSARLMARDIYEWTKNLAQICRKTLPSNGNCRRVLTPPRTSVGVPFGGPKGGGVGFATIFSPKGQLYERSFSLKLSLSQLLAFDEPRSAAPLRSCWKAPVFSLPLRARLETMACEPYRSTCQGFYERRTSARGEDASNQEDHNTINQGDQDAVLVFEGEVRAHGHFCRQCKLEFFLHMILQSEKLLMEVETRKTKFGADHPASRRPWAFKLPSYSNRSYSNSMNIVPASSWTSILHSPSSDIHRRS